MDACRHEFTRTCRRRALPAVVFVVIKTTCPDVLLPASQAAASILLSSGGAALIGADTPLAGSAAHGAFPQSHSSVSPECIKKAAKAFARLGAACEGSGERIAAVRALKRSYELDGSTQRCVEWNHTGHLGSHQPFQRSECSHRGTASELSDRGSPQVRGVGGGCGKHLHFCPLCEPSAPPSAGERDVAARRSRSRYRAGT